MAQNQQPDSIVDLIVGARVEPPRMSEEVELPTLFGPPSQSSNPLIAKEIEGLKPGRQVRMVSFTQTYVLWRPWDKCNRCKNMLADGELELPDLGDWRCPHVQVADYKDIKDKILRGDGIKEYEEHFQLHDGTRCVQFSWLETDPKFLEEMQKKAEAQKDRIYPPNPEAAFAREDTSEVPEAPSDPKEGPSSEET